jgi:thiamine biosynthesis lipoprotein
MSSPRETARERVGRRRTLLLVLVVVAAALAVRWLGGTDAEDALELAGATMGTSYSVTIDAELSGAERGRVRAAVEERLDRVNRLMSTYDTASELSRFNRLRDTQPVRASAELIEVLAMAHEVSRRSNGALDVTVAPLVVAWGFGPGSGIEGPLGGQPSPETLARLAERVGYAKIVVDRVAGTVAKTHQETAVDLSAIAKGYGVEAVADALDQLGLSSFLVELGGELRAVGQRRDGRPWRVGVERPDDGAPGVAATIALTDEGIATSGDYRDYYERDGVRYAHIIDPRTGRPIAVQRLSVTVVHASTAMADAWATALTVLGADEGYELARREGLAALFVRVVDGEVRSRATPALGDRVDLP